MLRLPNSRSQRKSVMKMPERFTKEFDVNSAHADHPPAQAAGDLGMHAEGVIREALQNYLDSDGPANEFQVAYDGDVKDLEWLLTQLWNCTDILPAGYCEQLDLSHGSTYAQAVRRIT